MNYIPTPYQNGVSLREDVFHRQFEIRVIGMTEYPEDDPARGTYQREEVLTVCGASTITGAVEKLIDFHRADNWPVRDDDKDYYDPDLGHDCGPLSFSPRFAKVFDRDNRPVLNGDFSCGLTWFMPVTSHHDISVLKAKQRALREYAANEARGGDFSMARDLRIQAARLDLYLVDKRYASLPEVQQLATRYYSPESGHLRRDTGRK